MGELNDKMEENKKPLLMYHPMHGKALSIRALLYHAKADFIDFEISRLDWPVFKVSGRLMIERLPIYIEDGIIYY